MTTKTPGERVVLVIRGVPAHLRRAFRIACLHRGQTMQDRIVELMERDVEDFREREREGGE
jgi:hypothetical protein